MNKKKKKRRAISPLDTHSITLVIVVIDLHMHCTFTNKYSMFAFSKYNL